jgi:hypothetical protein
MHTCLFVVVILMMVSKSAVEDISMVSRVQTGNSMDVVAYVNLLLSQVSASTGKKLFLL